MKHKHILKPAFELFIIAAITTTLLILVHALTLEPIQNNHRKTQEKMMREVIAKAEHFEEIQTKKSGSIVRVFEALNEGKIIGYVVELAPKGYDDTISMIVGISKADKAISGMRVLKHTETPGLGALAVSEKFYRQYNGKKLVPLKVVKPPSRPREDEIDAITSATITTRAVTNAVNEAIEWYQRSDLK